MLFPNELRNTWRFIYISISIHHAHPFTSNILNCDVKGIKGKNIYWSVGWSVCLPCAFILQLSIN